MTELKPEVIQEDMKRLAAANKNVVARLGRLEKRRQRLEEDIHREKKQVQSNKRDYERRTELLIISGIPEAVVKQRQAITDKRIRVRRTDITVAEQETLKSEIAEMTKAFQGVCQHALVLSYPSFPRLSSWDEPTPGLRVCAICNAQEQQYGDADYEVLSGDSRVIKGSGLNRDWHYHVDNSMLDMSYDELRESFIKSVG